MKRQRIMAAVGSCSALLISGGGIARADNVPAYFPPGMPPLAAPGCPATNPPTSPSPTMFQFTRPPNTGEGCTSFGTGPLTDATGDDVSAFVGSPPGFAIGKWPSIWANRAVRSTNPAYHGGAAPPNPMRPAICDGPDDCTKAGFIKEQIGVEYSTSGPYNGYDNADAATEATILYSLGALRSTWQQILASQGFTLPVGADCDKLSQQQGGATAFRVICYSDMVANPGFYISILSTSSDGNSKVLVNDIVVHDDQNCSQNMKRCVNYYFNQNLIDQGPTGITLDYEVNDYRTVAHTTTFLHNVAHWIHTQKFLKSYGGGTASYSPAAFLYTNPLFYHYNRGDDMAFIGNGFGTVSNTGDLDPTTLFNSWEYVSVFPMNIRIVNNKMQSYCDPGAVGSGSAYDQSLAFLKTASNYNAAQLLVTVDMGFCAPADALTLWADRSSDGTAGYTIFPNNVANTGIMGTLHFIPQNGQTFANPIIWALLYDNLSYPQQ